MIPIRFEQITSVAALVLDENRQSILMVEQYLKKAHIQQETVNQTFWSLPAGKVERQTLHQAIADELQQETGQLLTGKPRKLYTTKKFEPDGVLQTTVMLCQVQPGIDLICTNDPDQDILKAAWIETKTALRLLDAHPDESYSEPLKDYLIN